MGNWWILNSVKFNSKGDIIFKFIGESARYISWAENNIYLFGRLGLIVLTRSFEEVKISKNFENLKVSKVVDLNNTFIIVTTLGSGFYLVNKNDWSFQHYDSKINFVADNVYTALLVDSTLWLGTEKGVAVTKVQPLLRNRPSFQLYTKRNGLFSNRVAHLSYSAPNVWAYYDDGFSSLPANLPNEKQNAPQFYLKDIRINNQIDSLENLSELNFDQNNIQINFGFTDFKNQSILIRSRLSPGSNWNYATERNVKFFSLSPGDYLFELEYSVDNFPLGFCYETSIQYLLPVVDELAYPVCPAAAHPRYCFLDFFYYRRRIRVLREKQDLLKIINEQQQKLIRAELETLESERSRIAKDLHDSIGTNLAAIKLFLSGFFKMNNEPNAAIIATTLQGKRFKAPRIFSLPILLLPRFRKIWFWWKRLKIYSHRMRNQFDITKLK